MEPDSAVEMFNNALKENVKYTKYTGDDDSTTEAHIRQKVSHKVEKLSDVVHTKRSLTTRLYNLSQRGKFQNSCLWGCTNQPEVWLYNRNTRSFGY